MQVICNKVRQSFSKGENVTKQTKVLFLMYFLYIPFQ